MPKWLVIARNEYRLRTSGIRRFRPFFPFVITAFLCLYIFYLAPAIFSFFTDEFLAFFLSQAAVASVQLILLMIFLFFLVVPITYTLQQPEITQYELLLSAPLTPKDLLLGKFLGEMPLYAIGVVLVAGSFAAILDPLGLDALQISIIILIFILTFFSAFWIGTVIAAILRTRLGLTAHGRDIGKALAMIIALPMIALMYAIMSGNIFQSLEESGLNSGAAILLALIPSSWGAELIVEFVSNPGDLSLIWVDTLARFLALVIFFVGTLFLGTLAADRAYSLEPVSFSGERAKPEGSFYKTLRFLGGKGSFGTLLTSIFKDYSRRLENISKIVYMIGLLILISIFFGDFGGDESDISGEEELDVIGSLIMTAAILPFLAVFVMGEVTIRGRENLFIYRKAPGGEGRLVRARLLQGWLLILPISAIMVAFALRNASHLSIISHLAYIGIMVAIIAAYVAFALGLMLLMPVFSEKPAELMANVMIVMMLSMGIFLGSIIFFGEFWGLISALILSWSFGAVFLFLGKRRLSTLE